MGSIRNVAYGCDRYNLGLCILLIIKLYRHFYPYSFPFIQSKYKAYPGNLYCQDSHTIGILLRM